MRSAWNMKTMINYLKNYLYIFFKIILFLPDCLKAKGKRLK